MSAVSTSSTDAAFPRSSPRKTTRQGSKIAGTSSDEDGDDRSATQATIVTVTGSTSSAITQDSSPPQSESLHSQSQHYHRKDLHRAVPPSAPPKSPLPPIPSAASPSHSTDSSLSGLRDSVIASLIQVKSNSPTTQSPSQAGLLLSNISEFPQPPRTHLQQRNTASKSTMQNTRTGAAEQAASGRREQQQQQQQQQQQRRLEAASRVRGNGNASFLPERDDFSGDSRYHTNMGQKVSNFASPFSHNPSLRDAPYADTHPSAAVGSRMMPGSASMPAFNGREPAAGRRGPHANLPYGMQNSYEDMGIRSSYAQHSPTNRPLRATVGSSQRSRGGALFLDTMSHTADDDVMMDDNVGQMSAGRDYDDDDNEDDFEFLVNPQQAAGISSHMHPRSSTAKQVEPAWNDDASCIDVDEHVQLRNPAGEAFEVAALRRQVEQLQMALKKQMNSQRPREQQLVRQHQGMRAGASATGVDYAFGMPTPEPSRDNSTVGMASRVSASKSGYHGVYNQQGYPAIDSYNDLRNGGRQRFPGGQPSEYSGGARRSQPRSRVTSDPPTMSSVLVDESASAYIQGDEAQKMEELAKKIEALERMFQSTAMSSHHSETGSQGPHTTTLLPSTRQEHKTAQRTPSLSTLSTNYGRSRSPAASAFYYNATPYSREQESSLTVQHSNESSSSMQTRRKGVARFIMGVGNSRSNVPRDEHGNPVPTMQVSWSRKRTEKVAKPPTKMKVGPGRGRVLVAQKSSTPASQ